MKVSRIVLVVVALVATGCMPQQGRSTHARVPTAAKAWLPLSPGFNSAQRSDAERRDASERWAVSSSRSRQPHKLKPRKPSVRRVLGPLIHIRPGDANSKVVKGYLADLEDIPLSLARKIKALGIQIYLGNVSICKLGPAPPPCNETPPGWPSGTTYANVPGCGGLKEVDAGRGNSDAWSVVLHEFGHALGSDPRLGSGETPPAYDPGFLALHRRYYEELDPYSQGSGPGSPDGAEETFAEAFDGIVCHAPDLREYYPRPITDWIKRRLGLR